MIVVDKNNLTESNIKKFFADIFLFKSYSDDSLSELIRTIKYDIKEFDIGEKIYSPDDFEKKVGFVMEGECVVERRKHDDSNIPLNTLKKSDCFGILAVFSHKSEFPTQIRAKKNSRVLFIDSQTLITLVKENSEVAFAIISFMSERIEFLNKKIATFSADSVEEKFALYLLSESKRLQSTRFSLNLSKTAKVLNSGRASVYRAIESLEKLSLIEFQDKKIFLKDPIGLERNLK